MRDGKLGFVLCDQVGDGGVAGAGDAAEVPEFEGAVEGGGCEEVGVEGMDGEAADFLVGEGQEARGRSGGGSAAVVHTEEAVQGGEI